ncbi:MAG: helix-turn-helix domain-containing protein [Ilumatobacteraceae bacterium]
MTSSKDTQGFHDAAQSLKLYRRAELQTDEGISLIEDLYVDPLPSDHVLATMLKPNTTFLVGRKGTGKSTVFQRAQHELRRMNGYTSAYVDIKTVYESSQVDPTLLAKATAIPQALPSEALSQLLLARSFLEAVIREIREELAKRLQSGGWWQRIKESFGGNLSDLFQDLDELMEAADADRFISILGTSSEQKTASRKHEDTTTAGVTVSLGASSAPGLTGELGDTSTLSVEDQRTYSDVLMRVFDMKEYILRLKALLKRVGVNHLFVFVDDFSELPESAMAVVVDSLLAPLNNWSDELVKFKVAAYPGRVYFGAIDKTKIDEINLDTYSLYGTTDISAMEDKAIDFTRRLVERRIDYFCGTDATHFFESRGEDPWRLLFYASMGNPRILGYLMFYLYETQLIYDKRITSSSIRDVARRYYEEKVEPYFSMSRFLHESFAERSSVFSLKELLDAITARARSLRSHSGSQMLQELGGRPPTSHFHVIAELESLLATLELNFFLTKYYVMKDRDGRKVVVFALNYGLCQQHTLEFGRPAGRREFRLYYVERIFDCTPILQQYLRTNQEIVCDRCARKFDPDQLQALQLFGMLCPNCREGRCRVTNLSKKYEGMLREIDDELLLPPIELGILHTLDSGKRALFAGEIAGELDCSYQLIGKRGKNLADRGLVDRTENEQGRRQLTLTNVAERIYFAESDMDMVRVSAIDVDADASADA